MNRIFEYLGEGLTRYVFRFSKRSVIKIPRNWGGRIANERERSYYMCGGYLERDQMAACKMIGSCLIMEYVESYFNCGIESQSLPRWTDFVDCQQVGLNSKGQLVAYDYAGTIRGI
jgi:hypothetical protein